MDAARHSVLETVSASVVDGGMGCCTRVACMGAVVACSVKTMSEDYYWSSGSRHSICARLGLRSFMTAGKRVMTLNKIVPYFFGFGVFVTSSTSCLPCEISISSPDESRISKMATRTYLL